MVKCSAQKSRYSIGKMCVTYMYMYRCQKCSWYPRTRTNKSHKATAPMLHQSDIIAIEPEADHAYMRANGTSRTSARLPNKTHHNNKNKSCTSVFWWNVLQPPRPHRATSIMDEDLNVFLWKIFHLHLSYCRYDASGIASKSLVFSFWSFVGRAICLAWKYI